MRHTVGHCATTLIALWLGAWLVSCSSEPALPSSAEPSEASGQEVPTTSGAEEADTPDETPGDDEATSTPDETPTDDIDEPQMPDAIEGTWSQQGDETTLRITLFGAHQVRVQRFANTGGPHPDRGWLHTNVTWPDHPLEPTQTEESFIFEGLSLRVLVDKATSDVTITQLDGTILSEETGSAQQDSVSTLYRSLNDGDHFFGLGEKTGPLDKRGQRLTMWTTDAINPEGNIEPWSDPIYQSHPFYIGLRDGTAHGFYLENSHRSTFDFGATSHELSVSSEGGDIDYVIFAGPSMGDVVERYSAYVGRPFMPPLWTLGYHQCKWSYHPDDQVREIANAFRDKSIPADGMWLDIHYMDGYRSFTWSPDEFPAPTQLLGELDALGLKTTVIIDPGIKEDPGYWVYDEGMAHDYFVSNADGSVFVGEVWPGPSVFPDFTNPDARSWWASLISGLTDVGVEGVWIDMNEPTTFTGTFPLDTQFDGEGIPTTLVETRNLYASLMAQATHLGLTQARPTERPFVLTRAGFAGIQRYSATWTGDAMSSWEHLAMGPAMLSNLGLSGAPFVGSDVGGFTGDPGSELFARWMAFGSISPFFRGHVQQGKPGHEPWAYGAEAISRRLIELRYQLLPYYYSLMHQAHETGHPILRPLVLDYQGDDATYGLTHEIMVGPMLLAAPVVQPGVSTQSAYLPAGKWIDVHSGSLLEGGRTHTVLAPLNRVPLFAKANAIIPGWPLMQWTGEKPADPLFIDLFPVAGEPATSFELVADDGHTTGYQAGENYRVQLALTSDVSGATLSLTQPTGSFTPEHHTLHVRMHGVSGQPDLVRLGETLLTETESPDSEGWYFDAGKHLVHVVFPRPADATTIHVGYVSGPTSELEVDVEFVVSLPENTPDGPIYVAADVTGWTANGVMLERVAAREARGTLRTPANQAVNFKLTRGSWSTVQKSASCGETDNHTLLTTADFGRNHRALYTVERWADDGC